jgi:hypothetical protein
MNRAGAIAACGAALAAIALGGSCGGKSAPSGSGAPGSAGVAGASAGGGASGASGTTGNAGKGGAAGAGGASGAGGGAPTCKRGIAANTAPGPAFSPAVGWWYDWSLTHSAASPLEFVPMMWGSSSLTGALPAGAKYVLGFNEPNFMAQSNLTPQQAAADWPMIESKARAAGIPIVSPAMNFCGPAASCNGTDPYQYLKDFFAACTGCQVDYVAVHWYNCDLPSLEDYLEPGGNLEGFEQFGKPIWLTEFSCNSSASAADQEAYMRAAIPYLESNPNVYRYSWFSADPIPNAKLVNADGSPTALGQVYMSLPGACQ